MGLGNLKNSRHFGSPVNNFNEIPVPLDGDGLYHFRRIIPNQDLKVFEFITKKVNNLRGFGDINNFLAIKKRDDSIEQEQTRTLTKFITKGRRITTVIVGSEVVGGIGLIAIVDSIRRLIKPSNDQDKSIFLPIGELGLGILAVGASGIVLCWPQNLKKFIKVQKPEEFLQQFEAFLQNIVEERKNRLGARIEYLRHHIKELKKQNPINNELIECFASAKNSFKEKYQNRVHPDFYLEDSSEDE